MAKNPKTIPKNMRDFIRLLTRPFQEHPSIAAGVAGVLAGILLHMSYLRIEPDTDLHSRNRENRERERVRAVPRLQLADPKTLNQLHAISVLSDELSHLPRTNATWNQKYEAALDQLSQLYADTPEEGKRLVFSEARRLIHQSHMPPFRMSQPIAEKEHSVMTMNHRH